MGRYNIEDFYKKNYKKLFLVPVVIFVIAVIVIFLQYVNTGDIVNKDVSLKGGVSATVYSNIKDNGLEEFLSNKFKGDINVRTLKEFGSDKQIGIIVEASDVDSEELKLVLEERLNIKLNEDNYSVEVVGSSLGKSFYRGMIKAILVSFLFMAIVVFITFRTFIPSLAVVLAALMDIVVAIAVVDIIGLRISTAGIAAFLLVIGYSVDTDILLTTRILRRREDNIFTRLTGAITTGLTMTLTTVIALTIGYLFTNSVVLKEMFLIVIIALIFDIIVTYCMNAGLLIWYGKKKNIV